MYDFGIRQSHTGYRIGYRANETNHCPGCGQSHWVIGRFTAECAHCSSSTGIGTLRPRGNAKRAAA